MANLGLRGRTGLHHPTSNAPPWQGRAEGLGLGAVAIVGACIAWGIDNNLTQKLSEGDPVQIAMTRGLAAGAVNLLLAIGRGATLPPFSTIATAGLIGLLGYGESLVLFVRALRHLGTARTGAYFSTAPFIGGSLAIAFWAIRLQAHSPLPPSS